MHVMIYPISGGVVGKWKPLVASRQSRVERQAWASILCADSSNIIKRDTIT